MAKTVRWDKVDKPISGLGTDVEHEIQVQREAIPLIFIPGIMGTRLRRAGTSGDGKGIDGLPKMRWDPDSTTYLLGNHCGAPGADRKAMLVGTAFTPGYLAVDEKEDNKPVGDGFHGIMADYWKNFLNELKKHDWEALGKIFEFPVYAVGYNWTDDNTNSGKKLAARIKKIIEEAKKVTGLCEKVILITHSMGGLVARWASEEAGARKSILGIIHGVQPATGAPAAYWRIKAGFEVTAALGAALQPKSVPQSYHQAVLQGAALGAGVAKAYITASILGSSASEVAPVLGNVPGGLQLLPNKQHRTNDDSAAWLTVTESGKPSMLLPKRDPYEEIYRVKAVVKPTAGQTPSTNEYWGLVDPDLLDPENVLWEARSANNALDSQFPPSRVAWLQYLTMLDLAETFHDTLGQQTHPNTFCFWGTGHKTADVIEMKVGSLGVGLNPYPETDPYPVRGFRGFFTDARGVRLMAVLQDPSGDGDGTVAASSGAALNAPKKPIPGDRALAVEHQPAYEDGAAQAYTVQAIIALCKMRYDELRHPVGGSPTGKGAAK